MSIQLQEDGSFINSIVGEGTSFAGELVLNGILRVDGDFTGTIRTGGKVLVGINGRAQCSINAGTVVVGGVVKGNIRADEKVLILSTGMIIGDIETPRLIAEDGVVLHGSCSVTTDGGKSRHDAPKRYVPEVSLPLDSQPVTDTAVDGGPVYSSVEGER